MIDCELRCLSCGENLGVGKYLNNSFFILCTANDSCPEKEDKNFIEKRFFSTGLSRGQFRILEKYIGFKEGLNCKY